MESREIARDRVGEFIEIYYNRLAKKIEDKGDDKKHKK